MTAPPLRATYRLQFRGGFTFADAAALAPHLSAAGVSHVYASPIFRAVAGSTHGYDVADHNEIEPALGGKAGCLEMCAALKAHGLGLILDIVPNHMAAHTDNPWWRDVLQHGPASRFARHFDIDWSAPKLILPFLGQTYGEALEAGEIVRDTDPDLGPILAASGQRLPLAPGTERIADVDACHSAQVYRLTHWRLARDGLTYRRFFEIAGLVGVRVEDRAVFDDVHRLVASLIAEGHVHGLRVDHVDGLADPRAYLERLAGFGVPIFVEKILEHGEALPDWPVTGTTGYEFIAALAAAHVEPDGIAGLDEAYRAIAPQSVAAVQAAAKHEIATVNLAGEFARLTAMALERFADDPVARDHGPDTVRRSLVALSAAMPVYRSYIDGRVDDADRAIVEAARGAATADALDELRPVDDLAALILSGNAAAAPFVTRWQQTTGPLMAKAVEDTLFFRHHRFIAFNEVGGHPDLPLGTEALLRALATPGMATTQTHDTKRGEDSRARLYQLSEPSIAHWWSGFWPDVSPALPPQWQWALAQMWLGAVPLEAEPGFATRLSAAVLKSAREAKEETRWTRTNAPFEEMLSEAAEAIAGRRPDDADWRLLRAGAVTGLAQAVLKTFGVAIPDLYQGCLSWDFSLVDPDNRRPVDFAAEAALCTRALSADPVTLAADWTDGAIKARVLLAGLSLRRESPELFSPNARFCRLSAPDSPILVLWRAASDVAALCAVPLRPLRALGDEGVWLEREPLGSVMVDLPRPVRDRFSSETLASGRLDVAPLLARFPVLLADGRGGA